MLNDNHNYDLFFKFIQSYSASGFKGIDPTNPLIVELEEMMEKNNQFFFVGDIIQMQIFYASKRSLDMIGINPAELNPYHFFDATHPDDIQRHGMARQKIFRQANDLFLREEGEYFLSTNLRIRNLLGGYSNYLFQCYMLFTTIPYKTVLYFQLHTDIEWYKKIKHGYHYHIGNDRLFFRYPDDELLRLGNVFTKREFEIIKLIQTGLNSEQIAAKLFLSIHTVNTHRSNILVKSGKTSIPDLIYTLKERGLL